MRASTPTKLSLYDWTTIMGMSPLHVAGIDLGSIRGVHCTKPLPQYDWQEGDRVSREQIGRVIAMAEENMEGYLGYHVLPSYDVNESMLTPRAYPLPQGEYLTSTHYRAKWGYFIEGGRRAVTQLTIIPQTPSPPGPDVDIIWSDEDAPPPGIYWRIGTVLATVPVDTDPCEVRVYYPGHDADPAWEIRPATVTITNTTATIVFRRELAVNPDQWDALVYEAANGDSDADFLDTVDVFRVYTDPAQQIALYGHPHLCPACSTSPDPSAGEAAIIDPTLSQLHVAKGTWTNGVFTPTRCSCGPVSTRALFSYFSGYADDRQVCPTKTMDGRLAHAIAVYAAALLERPPCDCTVDSWEYWREDLAEGATRRYAFWAGNSTPFGTRRGAVYAWERVLELTLGQGAVLA